MTQDSDQAWRSWLRVLLLSMAALCGASYAAVVLIDPFSTGRFALTQRIDRASIDTWHWFAKAGIIRDQRFDAAIFGSSVSGALDPVRIGAMTGRKVLQATLYGAFPQDTLLASRAFERHHRGRLALHIISLEIHWCREQRGSIGPRAGTWLPPFPTWVYESSNYEYLTRIFYPFAINSALRRIGIWFGLREHSIRDDGFAPIYPPGFDAQAAAARLLSMKAETAAPPPAGPLPYLDDLAAQIGCDGSAFARAACILARVRECAATGGKRGAAS